MTESLVRAVFESVKERVEERLLVGSHELLEYFLISFFSQGHVLLEGPPGTGKTLAAKVMSHLLAKSFRRIQFTSDMLPGDILGGHIFSPAKNGFEFIPGPVFSDVVLADEINRAPPRTQSALLEAMEERQITIDGERKELSPFFFVVATQNPRDYEGTFALPEVQLDRFLFKIVLNHGSPEVEKIILELSLSGVLPPRFHELAPFSADLMKISEEISKVRVEGSILNYVTAVLQRTREHELLASGSSIRGGLALCRAARVLALSRGRDFVTPDDIKKLVIPTLRHRVRLSSDALVSNISDEHIIADIVSKTPFPS